MGVEQKARMRYTIGEVIEMKKLTLLMLTTLTLVGCTHKVDFEEDDFKDDVTVEQQELDAEEAEESNLETEDEQELDLDKSDEQE